MAWAEGEGRGDAVEEGTERQVVAPGADVAEGDARRSPAPDPQTTLPDLEGLVPVSAGVGPPAGSQAVEPRPDQPARHSPEGERSHGARLAADVLPAALGQPDGRGDAAGDEQAVDVETEGADIQSVGRRARQVGEERDATIAGSA